MSSRTGSIVDSETSIAPRTDSSASRFWGGTMLGVPLVANCSSVCAENRPAGGRVTPQVWIRARRIRMCPMCNLIRASLARKSQAASDRREGVAICGRRIPGRNRAWRRGAVFAPLLLRFGDDRLDRRRDPAADLDLDHVGPGLSDRLLEADLLAVDLDAARGLDRLGDLGGGDGAEELSVLSGAVVDRQHGLAEQGGGLAGAFRRLLLGLGGPLALALRLLERALGGGLRQLAWDEVVAQVSGRDVDGGPGLAEPVNVLEQNRLGHQVGLALADVGQQGELAGALDVQRELLLVLPGKAGDAPGPGLASIRDEAAQQAQVLVVDVIDADPRVLARATAIGQAAAPAASRRCLLSLLSSHEGGMVAMRASPRPPYFFLIVSFFDWVLARPP